MKTVHPNQAVSFTVAVFGAGGVSVPAALSAATLTTDGRTVAATVSGQTLTATVPAATALGARTLAWAWHQVAGGVASDQTSSEAVTVAAAQGERDWQFGVPVVNVASGRAALSTRSTEFVHVQITASDAATGAAQDPTADSVWLAFTAGGVPADADWHAGDWLTRSAASVTSYWARLLVGPGAATQLPAGALAVYVKVGDAAETPVAYAGGITVE